MGIAERKQREKEGLHQLTLSEVCTMANQEGWESISTRKIAEKIEYSTNKIYEEFGSKEGVLIELQNLGFVEMKKIVSEAIDKSKDAINQFSNVSLAIWNFAIARPELFQIMFGIKGAPCSGELYNNTHKFREYLIENAIAPIANGNKSLIFNWWVLVYGFISIGTEKCFNKKEMEQLFTEAIERFLKSFI